MSASSSESSVVVVKTRNDEDQDQAKQPLSPDAVFERLFDMFGMMADANVILEVGENAGWKRKLLLRFFLNVFLLFVA